MKVDSKLTQLETAVWSNTADVVKNEDDMYSADDDHTKQRSKRNNNCGMKSKHNPIKGLGNDQHGITTVGSGAIVCAHMETRDETLSSSFKKLLKYLGGVVYSSLASAASFVSANKDIAMDRGYTDTENVEHASEAGFRVTGTVKNNISAHSFKDRPGKNQIQLNPKGHMGAYYATSKLKTGAEILHCAYRSSNDKFVHLMSMSPWANKPFQYEYMCDLRNDDAPDPLSNG